MKPRPEIDIQLACQASDIPDEQLIRHWAEAALQAGGADSGSITVRIVEPEESRQLNAGYRGKDRATNVLSFPFSMPEGLPEGALETILGDLVICAAVVNHEASEQDKTSEAHWAHMLTHGVLHLLGHDHQSEQDASEMESLECRILADLGFANPYESNR